MLTVHHLNNSCSQRVLWQLEAASARAGLDESYLKAMDFLKRIHARPAYARALEKGGPYQIGR